MRLDTEERYYRYPLTAKTKGFLRPSEYQGIVYEPGKVTRIRLNRPRYLNALGHPVWAELEDAFDLAARDENCNVIVLSGEGKCFSSGDDVIGMSPEGAPVLSDRRTPEQLMKDCGSEDEVWRQYNVEHDHLITWVPIHKLQTVPKPTIAMVHGYCIYGAFLLATSMDLIFASEDALFLWGNDVRSIWDWGPRKALEIAFEHRFMTAREACDMHMVNRVYPDVEILERETLAYANRVADQPAAQIRRYKQLVWNVMNTQGYFQAAAASRFPFAEMWRVWAEEGHRHRYDGPGIGRSPVALRHLAAKLEGEGKEVPENVRAAIERADQRDDKGRWQAALSQSWRDPERVKRAQDHAGKVAQKQKTAKERNRRLKTKK